MTKCLIEVDKDLWRNLRLYCVATDQLMKDIIPRAIERYLKSVKWTGVPPGTWKNEA